MNPVFKYKTKQGLPVIFIQKKEFIKSFCGIGCKYGGANVKYKLNDECVKSSYGIAHFIEHKLFQMPDDSDAFMTFNLQYATANAYTSSDKTIYYFTKYDSIYDSLKLLLEMYFTPVFKEENVEHEKNIICSEIQMYEDNIAYKLSQKGLEHLYPKDDYSYSITGDCKSVNEITAKDLLNAYNAFYTPYNSVLCIVGNQDKDELFQFIENVMEKLSFSTQNPIKEKTIASLDVLKPEKIKDNVSQTEAMILIRMDDVSNKDAVSCEKILGILETVLNVSSKFYQHLYDKKLFINDIDYQVVTYLESSYIMINAPTKKPKAFALEVIQKLKNLTEADMNDELIDLYLKHLKAKSILSQDSIDSLGDTILSLALEEIDYFDSLDKILALTKKDLIDEIHSIKNAKMTYLIFEK